MEKDLHIQASKINKNTNKKKKDITTTPKEVQPFNNGQSRLKKKKILFIILLSLFTLVICLFSIELYSLLLIKNLGYNWEPIYLRLIKGYQPSRLYGGRTEYLSWGQWGVPNYEGCIRNNCIDVKYKFNSWGSRDKERSLSGKNRTLVLGDSFIEGYGVDQDKTLPADLEKITGNEFLNFGVAGGYGVLNEYILYKDFAKKFEHDAVMVGLTIGNDITDNDTAAWLDNAKIHHFPFWKLSDDKKDFKIVYYTPSIKGRFVPELEPKNKAQISNFYTDWKDISAFLRMSDFIKDRKIFFDNNSVFAKKTNYNLPFPEDNITATLLAYGKFSELIGNKKKYVVVFPSINDIYYYFNNGKKKLPKFEEFKNTLTSQGWQVIDTLEAFSNLKADDIPKYYIVCDGHPSAEGHKLFAQHIIKFIK